MSLRGLLAAAIVLIAVGAVECRAWQDAAKGYEMYSWKVKGHWHYSVLPGTDRAKNYEEITSKENSLAGTVALKDELKKIPRGGEVYWRSAAHQGVRKPLAKGSAILELPSRKRIKGIKSYCDKLGIKLKLV